MSTNEPTHELVPMSVAVVRLGLSATTIRDRIKAGTIEAERVTRPQGTAFLVKVPVEAQSTREDAQQDARDERGTPDQERGDARAGAAQIEAATAPLLKRLEIADQQNAAKDALILSLTDRVARAETRAEHERARAARAEWRWWHRWWKPPP